LFEVEVNRIYQKDKIKEAKKVEDKINEINKSINSKKK
jgi:hypothetical protein